MIPQIKSIAVSIYQDRQNIKEGRGKQYNANLRAEVQSFRLAFAKEKRILVEFYDSSEQ